MVRDAYSHLTSLYVSLPSSLPLLPPSPPLSPPCLCSLPPLLALPSLPFPPSPPPSPSFHSLLQPVSNADFIVPVEIDGVIHQVYVLKRPFVDEFLQRMGELFECVLFTASLAKVSCAVGTLDHHHHHCHRHLIIATTTIIIIIIAITCTCCWKYHSMDNITNDVRSKLTPSWLDSQQWAARTAAVSYDSMLRLRLV